MFDVPTLNYFIDRMCEVMAYVFHYQSVKLTVDVI